MKINDYLKTCNKIYHLTLDPRDQSVIRIHLIPPKKTKINSPWVVILNGYYILPLQTGWAILLKEFIEEVKKDEDNFQSVKHYIEKAATKTKEVFPKAPLSLLRSDVSTSL